jgi:hypothetical protein
MPNSVSLRRETLLCMRESASLAGDSAIPRSAVIVVGEDGWDRERSVRRKRGCLQPRAQRLERNRMPRVVAGDTGRRSGSFARLNASPRAGANLRPLQERPHAEAAPCPHCKDVYSVDRSLLDTVIRTFAPDGCWLIAIGRWLSAVGYCPSHDSRPTTRLAVFC